jgi:Domain of unknown function (DUF3806)
MTDQKIEAQNDSDIDAIARALIHTEQVISEALGSKLTGSRAGLVLIQRLLDAGTVEREATYTLQALGLAFGKVSIEENSDYDWWMVEDEFGRDPAIRYKHTTLLAFPRTMLSKRGCGASRMGHRYRPRYDGRTREIRLMTCPSSWGQLHSAPRPSMSSLDPEGE